MRRFLQRLRQLLVAAPFHVALSAANPHLSDHHIFQNDLIGSLDAYAVGSTRFRCPNGDFPSTSAVGGGFMGSGIPSGVDFNFFSRTPPPPQLNIGLLLKHHVTAQDIGQTDLGLGN